jgi:MscS family membrane protein
MMVLRPIQVSRCIVLYVCLLFVLILSAHGQRHHARSTPPQKPPTTGQPAQTPTGPNTGTGEETPPATTPAAEPAPVDPLGRSTPYGCVIGFLQAVNDNNLINAAQYLDTKLPEAQAEQLAQQLKAVLDSGLSSSINGLSREPQGNVVDDLRVSREKVGVAKTPNGSLPILLDRVKRPQAPTIWLFSAETLLQIPDAYAHLQQKDVSHQLPGLLVKVIFLGLPLWRWLAILIAIALAILLSSLVTRLLLLLFKLVLDKEKIQNEEELLRNLKQPVRLLLLALALWIIETYALSVLARHYWTASAWILATIGIAWFLTRLIDIFADVGARRSVASGAKGKIAVITLGRRLFKILALFTALLILLKGAGVNVSAMLAGLGIGGIALALAAQKTLEDLFGGISIIMRDAIRVGDFCRLADESGTIEDIGLSATRLRTLDRTVVSIPNAKIAQMNSENISLRDKFWFHHILSLRYDTSNAQIEQILTNLQKVIRQASEIELGSSHTNLLSLKEGSFQVEVFAYVIVSTYELFLVRQQELLLQILAAVSDSGAHLAVPSPLPYVEGIANDPKK